MFASGQKYPGDGKGATVDSNFSAAPANPSRDDAKKVASYRMHITRELLSP